MRSERSSWIPPLREMLNWLFWYHTSGYLKLLYWVFSAVSFLWDALLLRESAEISQTTRPYVHSLNDLTLVSSQATLMKQSEFNSSIFFIYFLIVFYLNGPWYAEQHKEYCDEFWLIIIGFSGELTTWNHNRWPDTSMHILPISSFLPFWMAFSFSVLHSSGDWEIEFNG